MIMAFLKSIVSAMAQLCRWPGRSRVIRRRSGTGLQRHSCRIDHGFSLKIDTPMHFAFGSGNEPRIATVVSPCRKIDNSLAMVKNSENPYLDFKSSMLQMVFEKGIEAESDLEELLKCFLKMNSPANHPVIAQAFVEIWEGVSQNKSISSYFNGNPIEV